MILLAGGAGYIGLHTAAVLIEAGHPVVLFDNFSNSKSLAVKRLEAIAGGAVPCVAGDVRSRSDLDGLFDQYPVSAVIHFAGLTAVGSDYRFRTARTCATASMSWIGPKATAPNRTGPCAIRSRC